MNNLSVLLIFFLVGPFGALVAQDNLDSLELNKIYRVTHAKRDSLYVLSRGYSEQLNTATDSPLNNQLLKKLFEIERAGNINDRDELQQELNFVQTHLASSLSLQIMSYKIRRKEGSECYPIFASLFNDLSPSLRNSEEGRQLGETLSYLGNSRVGCLAPEFKASDRNKEQLTLSSFKHSKVVLLDFWASWCVPCRQDFPFLKQVYKKYNSEGFEIISISRDSGREEWLAAIESDGIGLWKHLSTEDNGHFIPSSYYVLALPTKVLVDREGRIIARWRGGGEENKAELEKALIDIFEKPSDKGDNSRK